MEYPQLAPQNAHATIQPRLEGPGPDVGETASRFLQVYPTATLRAPLLRLLGDKDSAVRVSVLSVLHRLPCKDILPDIRKLLDDDSTPVRRAAALILAANGEKEALPELATLLRDPEADRYAVRNAAIYLGSDAVPDLRPMLRD